MKNILLINPMPWFETQIQKIRIDSPGVMVTSNYQEVESLVRAGEVERVCIVLGAYNYSKGGHSNSAPAGVAARELHALSPDLPLLAWNDPENELSRLEEGVLYLQSDDLGPAEFFHIIKIFFNFELPMLKEELHNHGKNII
jgi:hypothetical protein